jgi:hypothetical protein
VQARRAVTDISIVVLSRRVELLAVLVWFSAVVVTHSDAGVSFPVWVFLFLGFIGLAGWWLIRAASPR